ncbi:hypothetical protein C0J52_05492 [Blattella germanica]|nr:hypothetical protein C0J52_05492 [Blattella germanica]
MAPKLEFFFSPFSARPEKTPTNFQTELIKLQCDTILKDSFRLTRLVFATVFHFERLYMSIESSSEEDDGEGQEEQSLISWMIRGSSAEWLRSTIAKSTDNDEINITFREALSAVASKNVPELMELMQKTFPCMKCTLWRSKN